MNVKNLMRTSGLAAASAVILVASPCAAIQYVEPTIGNLASTLIKFKAIDLHSDPVVDDVARAAYCDVYQRLYKNDIEWDKVRQAMRKSFELRDAKLPIGYALVQKVSVARYNEARKGFVFKDNGAIQRSSLSLLDSAWIKCGTSAVEHLPTVYFADLAAPIVIDLLPADPEDAKVILKHMSEDKEDKRIVYIRFNLRILKVPPQYDETSKKKGFHLDASLDSVEAFDDPELNHRFSLIEYDRSSTSIRDLVKIPALDSDETGSGTKAAQ